MHIWFLPVKVCSWIMFSEVRTMSLYVALSMYLDNPSASTVPVYDVSIAARLDSCLGGMPSL